MAVASEDCEGARVILLEQLRLFQEEEAHCYDCELDVTIRGSHLLYRKIGCGCDGYIWLLRCLMARDLLHRLQPELAFFPGASQSGRSISKHKIG
jgi:hypothetical protein